MFRRQNVLVVNQRPPHTEYVTREIREHRAPTDDSVKLLREMEAKAQEQIVEAIHVGDTTFECVVHTIKMPMDDATKWMAIFSLNGKKITAEYQEYDWKIIDKRDVMLKLRDAMAEKIATEVLIPALSRLT